MLRVIWQVCLVVSPAVVANAASVQWPVSEGGNGHYYEGVPSGSISWDSASAQAQQMGGYLATITSAEESAFVFANVASNPSLWVAGTFAVDGPWLGARQLPSMPPAEGWYWVTGEPWAYTNWALGQPDDYHGDAQDAVHLWGGYQPGGQPQPYWDDVGHSHLMPSFIVESVPEPATIAAILCGTALGLRRRAA